MPPETFLGLTALQVQGCAAIASVVLTLALVGTGIWYGRATWKSLEVGQKSNQHMIETEQRELDRERAIVGLWLEAMVADLSGVAESDLTQEAIGGRLPERVLGLGISAETLVAYARGIGADVSFHVATILRQVEVADWALRRIRTVTWASPEDQRLLELAQKLEFACKAGAKTAGKCLALLHEQEGSADLRPGVDQ